MGARTATPTDTASAAARPTAAANGSAARQARDASTREAVVSQLLRLGDATAAELATALGVSVQAMRRHLRSLEEDGLVQASSAAAGPGRPSNRWQLTAKAQSRLPDGSEDFAIGLLESMTGSLPADTIASLLSRQALHKAEIYRSRIGSGSFLERLERLVQLRCNEGFVSECCPDPEGDGWLLREFHCSVMRIAEQFPCVCDQELQLIRQTFPDCQVDRVHWRLEKGHSCGFRLRPNAPVLSPTPS